MITSSNENVIKIWDDLSLFEKEIKEPIHILEGHKDAVLDIKYNSSKKTLISAGYDMLILLWDLEKYTVKSIITPDNVVWKIALFSD